MDDSRWPRESVSSYFEATRADVLPLVPAVSSYLDVGCAAGHFGAELKQRHPDSVVWGIEPTEGPAMIARQQLDHVIQGLVPECLSEIHRRFECIICNDVLEHMTEPWSALKNLVDLLDPQGTLIASIPSVRNPQTIYRLVVRGRWDYEDSGVLDRTHIRFFTRATAQELLESAGLEVSDVVGSFPLGEARLRWLRLSKWPLLNRLLFRQYIFVTRLGGPDETMSI